MLRLIAGRPLKRFVKRRLRVVYAVLVLIPSVPSAAVGQAPSLQLVPETNSLAVQAHVTKAKEVAGDKFAFLANSFLCEPAANAIPLAMQAIPGFLDPKAPGVEPFKAFDNLYYVGLYAIGTWILDTGEGLVVFDALNNEAEVRAVLIPDMYELGLNPNDMKTVVVTHAHFDHYGGADFLKRAFGPRIAMSSADWEYLPSDIALPYAYQAGYPKVVQPVKDVVVHDGQVLEMGSAQVQFIVTPGHTPGTLSSIITVNDAGKARKIGMWGGQALPQDAKELAQMHDSLHKFWNAVRAQGVEGLISTHAWVVGNFELRQRSREVGENPLLIGAEGVEQIMRIYDECIAAQFARIEAAK